jgi:hypothetical protein
MDEAPLTSMKNYLMNPVIIEKLTPLLPFFTKKALKTPRVMIIVSP